MTNDPTILKPAGRVLSTLEEDGSRRWLHPRLAPGRFWSARRAVAYGLIALFNVLPFLTVGGKPVVLLDVVRRRFTLLGFTFLPTDTVLLALAAVTVALGIFLVTALLGRVWCGWGCPQTVYLEFVYRPIERLFTGRRGTGGKPRDDVAAWRYAAMYAAFLVISVHLANVFLAYFVGVPAMNRWVTGSPADHLAGFTIVSAVTGLMMFNFCFFREQTCLIACPYGRLQSVLLDKWSLIISYDRGRGEPRGKLSRAAKPAAATVALPVLARAERSGAAAKGDCVDCGLCVAVCPTGIDIRDGLQFECVGCAQCIDVCNTVMDRVARPRGLIRYSSQAAMGGEKPRLLRPRVVVYPLLIVGLLSLLGYLLATKEVADVTVLRSPGQPFLVTPAGEVVNVIRVKVTNRTDEPQRLTVGVVGDAALRAVAGHAVVEVPPGQSVVEPLDVFAPAALFAGKGAAEVTVRVTDAASGGATTAAADVAGEDPRPVRIDRTFRLLGPATANAGVPTATVPATAGTGAAAPKGGESHGH